MGYHRLKLMDLWPLLLDPGCRWNNNNNLLNKINSNSNNSSYCSNSKTLLFLRLRLSRLLQLKSRLISRNKCSTITTRSRWIKYRLKKNNNKIMVIIIMYLSNSNSCSSSSRCFRVRWLGRVLLKWVCRNSRWWYNNNKIILKCNILIWKRNRDRICEKIKKIRFKWKSFLINLYQYILCVEKYYKIYML